MNISFAGVYFGSFGHFWYKFLDRKFPGIQSNQIMKKLSCEMAMGPPLVCGAFFVVGKIKGKSWDEIFHDLKLNFFIICLV